MVCSTGGLMQLQVNYGSRMSHSHMGVVSSPQRLPWLNIASRHKLLHCNSLWMYSRMGIQPALCSASRVRTAILGICARFAGKARNFRMLMQRDSVVSKGFTLIELLVVIGIIAI